MYPPLKRAHRAIERYELSSRVVPVVLVLLTVGVIIALPTPLNAGAILAPAAGLLLLLYPILLPVGIIASVPIQDAIPLPENLPVTATRAFTAAALALIPFVLIGWRERVRWSRFMLAILLLMLAMTISLYNADSLSASANELYRWFLAGFTFWLVLQFIRTRSQFLAALGVTAVLSIAQGGLGIIQSLTGAGPASFQIGGGFARSFGTFGMPNSFAAYMEVVALPLIPLSVWALGELSSRLRAYRFARLKGYVASTAERRALLLATLLLFLFAAGAVIGVSAIATSFSRGGWLGSIAAIAVMVVLLGRRTLFTTTIIAAVVSLTLFLAAPGAVLSEIQERFGQLVDQAQIGDVRRVAVTSDNFATVERMSHWQTAIAMWDQHPWIGVGAGNFNDRFTEFAIHPQFEESQGHAHNYYLHLLAETGLIGLAAYVTLLVAAVCISWRALRSNDRLVCAIGIGALGMTVALIVHNVFENLHVLNITLHMMFIWALAVAGARWFDSQRRSAVSSDQRERLL